MTSAMSNPLLVSPTRAAFLGVLVNTRLVETSFFAEHFALTMEEAAEHLSALKDAGYVKERRGTFGIGKRRWHRITGHGQVDFAAHLELVISSAGTERPSDSG